RSGRGDRWCGAARSAGGTFRDAQERANGHYRNNNNHSGGLILMRVLAAMSGRVDSAVAAARAVESGHEVVGVHLALSAQPGTLRQGARGCCTIEDSHDARRVADLLDIPFYVWDFAER